MNLVGVICSCCALRGIHVVGEAIMGWDLEGKGERVSSRGRKGGGARTGSGGWDMVVVVAGDKSGLNKSIQVNAGQVAQPLVSH